MREAEVVNLYTCLRLVSLFDLCVEKVGSIVLDPDPGQNVMSAQVYLEKTQKPFFYLLFIPVHAFFDLDKMECKVAHNLSAVNFNLLEQHWRTQQVAEKLG